MKILSISSAVIAAVALSQICLALEENAEAVQFEIEDGNDRRRVLQEGKGKGKGKGAGK